MTWVFERYGYYMDSATNEPLQVFACSAHSKKSLEEYNRMQEAGESVDLYSACPGNVLAHNGTHDLLAEGPGGLNGKSIADVMCDAGRTGLACGMCKDKYNEGPDGTCTECGAGGGFGVFIVLLAVAMVIPGSYFVINSPMTAKLSNTATLVCSLGSFVSMLQMISVVGEMGVRWPEELNIFWAFVSAFALDVRVLQPMCIVGSGTRGFVIVRGVLESRRAVCRFTELFIWYGPVSLALNFLGTK